MPLKSRHTNYPPGGFQYQQIQDLWKSNPTSNFNKTVKEIQEHRMGNPALCKQYSLSTNFDDIANELDEYTCRRIRYDPAYCRGEPANPKMERPHNPSVLENVVGGAKRIIAGVRTLLDWLGSSGVPVKNEIAEERAVQCMACSFNTKGDWKSHFTIPAAKEIQTQLEIRNELSLKTKHDDQLRVCSLCDCPLKLKVHVPLEHIYKHMTPEVRQRINIDKKDCWILKGF